MEAFTRVWSRAIGIKAQANLAQKLQPQQFGIGVDGGQQIIPMLIQTSTAENHVVLQTDVSNAYGSISRTALRQTIEAQGELGTKLFD